MFSVVVLRTELLSVKFVLTHYSFRFDIKNQDIRKYLKQNKY